MGKKHGYNFSADKVVDNYTSIYGYVDIISKNWLHLDRAVSKLPKYPIVI